MNMRPYLAIIKDSFRAALASRILYVLLGLIILFLLIIAPAHIRETLDTRIVRDRDLRDASSLLQSLNEDRQKEDNVAVNRIWSQLSDELKASIVKTVGERGDTEEVSEDEEEDDDDDKGSRRGRRGGNKPSELESLGVITDLVDELNELIKDDDFYREEDWKSGVYGLEAQELIDVGDNRTKQQSDRLNRILITKSLGSNILEGARTSLDFYYATWRQDFLSSNSTRQQFASQVTSSLPYIFDKFVLSIGLLIAILVTANIIPQTFEPGTLNLLLSKPLGRAGLYIAKFVGGCIFVALCASVLFVGIWLWMGLALGIWERSTLISIPLYIIVFAIYYSVSGFVGLTTRSTILAIVVTGVFWALCSGVGFTYQFFAARMEAQEVRGVVPTSDNLIQVDPLSTPSIWDSEQKAWIESKLPAVDAEEAMARGILAFAGGAAEGMPPTLGPSFDPVSGNTIMGRFLFTDAIKTRNRQQLLVSDDNGETFTLEGSMPRGTTRLFTTSEGIIAVSRRGDVHLYNPNPKPDEPVAAESDSDEEAPKKPAKKKKDEFFIKLGPQENKKDVRNGDLVAINQKNLDVAIYNNGELSIFALEGSGDDRQYVHKRTEKIDTDTRDTMSCRIDYQGNTVLLVLGNGQIISVDATTLRKKKDYLPEVSHPVDSVVASPDGRWFAVLYRNETVWLLDTENDAAMTKARVGGQGSISAVHFNDDEILVADRTDRVTSYSLSDFSKREARTPSGSYMDKAYRYAIKPLYFAFPKPGEFYKVVSYLSSSSDTKRNPDVDLTTRDSSSNPWSPLTSGLTFMAVMLGLSCLTFSRTDY